ncbi:MAG: putative outer rane lipoprotein [Deltaproteobacteria bacterium]|nr:putative outer rane lipoprotein [Deltaproteobacteria bacterium]
MGKLTANLVASDGIAETSRSKGSTMTCVLRVLRHSWVSSALIVTACMGGGSKMAQPSSVASSGGGYYGPQPAPEHVAAYEGDARRGEPQPDRPGLGTQWGESVSAPISFSPFVRSSSSPWGEAVLHYNDAEGVGAHAAHLGSRPQPLEVYAGDGSIGIALVDEAGRTLPGFTAQGRALIIGEDGARYRIVVRNGTTARFEIVASVDGLDVIDGKPADPNRRGYIVDPHGVLVIDGFRTSDSAVAAFRFGRVADSYAAQTSGDRNVGVVGLAVFSERGAVWSPAELDRRDTADPFPQRGYAVPAR